MRCLVSQSFRVILRLRCQFGFKLVPVIGHDRLRPGAVVRFRGRGLPERVATGLPWAVTHTVHPMNRCANSAAFRRVSAIAVIDRSRWR